MLPIQLGCAGSSTELFSHLQSLMTHNAQEHWFLCDSSGQFSTCCEPQCGESERIHRPFDNPQDRRNPQFCSPRQYVHDPHCHKLAIKPVLLVEATIAARWYAASHTCCQPWVLLLLLWLWLLLLLLLLWLLWLLWHDRYQRCVHKEMSVSAGCEVLRIIMML